MLHVLGPGPEIRLTPGQFRQIYAHLRLAEIAQTGRSVIAPVDDVEEVPAPVKTEVAEAPEKRTRYSSGQRLQVLEAFKAQENKDIHAAAAGAGVPYNTAFNMLVDGGLHRPKPKVNRRRSNTVKDMQNRILRSM